jgi:hypothetical protein
MDEGMERRGFVKILTCAGISGTALLNACVAATSESGTLSPEVIEALLAFTDQEQPTEDELDALVSSLEGLLEDIRTVRAYPVAQSMEPSLKFRAGIPRPSPTPTAASTGAT